MSDTWKLRLRLLLLRLWQPTGACMTCMPGGLAKLASGGHWMLALQTGLLTGLFVLLLTFTPAIAIFRNRFGNATLVAALTVVADHFAHPDHYGGGWVEPLITGAMSFSLALIGSYVFEDRARRVRALWGRLAG